MVCRLSGLDEIELHRTFNMGVGMVIATNDPNDIILKLEELGEKAYLLGNVTKGNGKIFLDDEEL